MKTKPPHWSGITDNKISSSAVRPAHPILRFILLDLLTSGAAGRDRMSSALPPRFDSLDLVSVPPQNNLVIHGTTLTIELDFETSWLEL